MSDQTSISSSQNLTPYLITKGAADAIAFYKKALNATQTMRLASPDGRVMHAELSIAGSRVMLADEFPEMGAISPTTLKGTTVGFYVAVPNVDAAFAQAIAAGGTVVKEVADQFYGERMGTFLDPFGHKWSIATHIEDVAPEEMERRFKEMMERMSG